MAVFEDWETEMGRACFFGVDSTDHLGLIVEGLLSLEGALTTSHSLTDDLGVLVDPDISSSGEEVFANLAKHEISLLFTIIKSETFSDHFWVQLSYFDKKALFSFLSSYNINMKTRKLVIDTQTGKISLSRSIPTCEKCPQYARKISELQKEVVVLSKDNQMHAKREKEMDILC